MNNGNSNNNNGKRSFLKRLTAWKKPSYKSQDEHFLVETENFGTGLWRAIRMFIEYMRGFYAFKHVRNCVTVFGSARFPEQSPHYQLARDMGQALARAGFTVMTGGGPGIMEAINRGAKDVNGKSIACNIRIAQFEAPNNYVDKRITLRYFFVRKVMLAKYSCAFIFMPGGFGTLDEFFEVATLIQTKKIKNYPTVLMGTAYWAPLLEFMYTTLLAQNTIKREDIEKLLVTDSPPVAIKHIENSLANIVVNHK